MILYKITLLSYLSSDSTGYYNFELSAINMPVGYEFTDDRNVIQ